MVTWLGLTAGLQASGYSMQITFTNFSGKGTLTNFPALVILSTNNTDNYTGFLDTTNGWDLRFWTNSTLSGTELNYEIELFATNSNSYVWVQLPELTNNLSIWASWGDSAASNQQAYTTNGATWESNYVGVWHLHETPAHNGSHTDSTSNDYNGTFTDSNGNSDSDVDAVIDGGDNFNGDDDYVDLPNMAPDFSQGLTYTIWAYPETAATWSRFLTTSQGQSDDNVLLARNSSSTTLHYDCRRGGSSQSLSAGSTIELNKWQMFTVTHRPTGGTAGYATLYKNGVEVAGGAVHIPDGSITRTDNYIGNSAWSGDAEFDGTLDEARVSTVERSSNWVWACFMNQGTNHLSFVEYGAPEVLSPFSSLAASNLTTTSATMGAVLEAPSTNYSVDVFWGPTDGGTNAGSWSNTAFVGAWTNEASVNISASTNGLTTGTRYYFTFRGTNAGETAWASVASFWTIGPPGVDNVNGASGIDIGTATLNGRVISTNGASLDHVRIYFGNNDGGATKNWDTTYTFTAGSISEGVPFSIGVSNLYYGETYYYRAYASNSYGEAWSAVSSFLTATPSTTLGVPVTNNLIVHYDANLGVTTSGSTVTQWDDQSGNDYHATSGSGSPELVSDALNSLPTIRFDANEYLNVDDSFYVREHYAVGRSRNVNWNNYGAFLDDRSSRNYGYLFESGNKGFHWNQYPAGVSKNGTSISTIDNDCLDPIDQYMVLRIDMRNVDTGDRTHYVNRSDHSAAAMDICEIIGYSTELSSADEAQVGGYLAYKYGIATAYSGYTPPVSMGISNSAPTTITDTSATLPGSLNCEDSVFDVYVYWSTNSNTNASEWVGDGDASNVLVASYTNVTGQALSQSVTGLTQGVTYYFTYMATNDATNIWASATNFVADGAPLVENGAVSSYVGHAVLRGNMLATNGGPTTAIIYWGTTDGGSNAASWANTNVVGVTGLGTFSHTAYGLEFSTSYYFRCFASNSFGTSWATSSISFVQYRPVYVDVDASGANNGSSWTDAYTSFESGLDNVNANSNTIWVADGTYTHGSQFQAEIDGTVVYGGFTGTETSLLQRNWTNNEVVLSGAGSRRVIEVKANNVTLDGVTITNGYITSGDGAGILMNDGVGNAEGLTLANCRIVNNQNNDIDNPGGGARFYQAGNVLITNCVFANNIVRRANGIGIDSYECNLTIVDSIIRGGTDTDGNKHDGAGVYFRGSGYNLNVTRCQILDNGAGSTTSDSEGGGVYVYDGTARIVNTVFARNQAGNDGGGLYHRDGTLTVDNCTFASNRTTTTSGRVGGGLYINSGTANVKNTIFSGNWAGNGGWDGDNLYHAGGTLTISYCSFEEGLSSPSVELMGGTVNWGSGIFTNDPQFVSSTNYHLKSTIGHWDGSGWVADSVHSPCIDRGDGADDYSLEPLNANGGRINLGAYGGLAEASKSGVLSQPAVTTRTAQVFIDKAKLRGELLVGSISDMTFYYGTNNATTNASAWGATATVSVAYLPGEIFSADIIGLLTNQTYYFTVFASNDYGTAWGDVDSFMTGSMLPTGGGTNIIHVDVDATGFNDGTSWTNAYTQLADAIAAATASKKTIWMADGDYSYRSTFEPSTDGMAIYGGFNGTETNLSQRNWTNNEVRLNGQAIRRVMEVKAHNVILDGLTITNGYITSGDAAGILMDDGTATATNLTLVNSRVVNNQNDDIDNPGGGARFYQAGDVMVSNCVFDANEVRRANGIGIDSYECNLTIIDSTIQNGTDNDGNKRDGAGVYFRGSGFTLNITNCRILDNGAGSSTDSSEGGGVYIYDGTANILNTVIARNRAGNDGGGVYHRSGTLTLEHCTIVSNRTITTSGRSGGALYVNSGTVTVTNSILWANWAGNGSDDDGDVIYRFGGSITIDHTCMDGTTAPYVFGGGVTLGDGIITNDPLFAADFTDFHLKSTIGRWNGSTWVTDGVHSPCIDGGNPNADYSNEPAGENGLCVNMGAYGNTAEASKSTNVAPVIVELSPQVFGDSAWMRGQMTAGAASQVTLYYGLSDEGQVPAAWDSTNVFTLAQTPSRVIQFNATGLQTNQTYHYIFYATNSFGFDWSDSTNFMIGGTPAGGGSGVIHVDADATAGSKDGTSWANAYVSLANALTGANNGEGTNIWIATGSYSDGSTFLVETNGLAIYGGFVGTETNLSQRNWTNNEVRLDGQALRRVMEVKAHNVVLDGLTITNGYTTSGDAPGLLIDDGTSVATNLSVLNCRIVNNQNTDFDNPGGGARFYQAGDVLVSNCVFDANIVRRANGIGIDSYECNLTIIDTTIKNGTDTDGNKRDGAGLYFRGSSHTLDMRGCEITDNGAGNSNSDAEGGGIYIYDGTATIRNTVIARNRTGNDGGGIYHRSGSLLIENCTIVTNRTTTTSGRVGGGLYVAGGTASVSNSIFWANWAADDSGSDGDQIYLGGGTLNVGYSCIFTNSAGFVQGGGTLNWNAGNITNDPIFVSNYSNVYLRSSYGRWTASGLVYDYQTSPCIDAGDPAVVHTPEPDHPSGNVNMGAYGNTDRASYGVSNGPPRVSNSPGALETIESATLRGTLMSTGNAPTTVWTFWGTTDGVTTSNNWDFVITNSTFDNDGIFSSVVTSVYYGVDYYYRVAASNTHGMTWATNSVRFRPNAVQAPIYTNALRHTGYHVAPTSLMDIDNNGGMVDTNNNVPYGTAWLTSGPGNRGLDFDSDSDFTATGAIGQNDNYQNLFYGLFFPPTTGTYEFRVNQDDDYSGMWIDRDRDGIFESTSSGLGSDRGEQLTYENTGTRSVTLTNGLSYLVGFTHGEGGGGSGIDVRFKTPAMGSQVVIKPSDAAQDGYWRYLLGYEYVAPDVFTNISATNIQETSAYLNVDYSGTSSVFNVTLYYGTSNGGSNAAPWDATNVVGSYTNISSATLSTNIGSLTADTTYYAIFNGVTPNGVTSIWSDVMIFGTAFPAGDAPSNLTVNAVGVTIELTWEADTFDSETGFVIQSSPNGTASFTDLAVVGPNVTNYVDSLGIGGTTYYYRVAASNLSGLSDWSNTNNAIMPALPADIYVTTNGTHPTGPSWQFPTSLTNALATASANDTIWVAQGTYTHTDHFIFSTAGVELYGGFVVGATSTTNRDLVANETIFDGEDSHRVIDIRADNIVLDGLTVTNGRLTSAQHGAGLRMDNGSADNLVLANCRFVNNVITDGDEYGAGAEFRNATSVLITNCVFDSNVGNAGYGIGFSAYQANVTVQDSRISNNLGQNTADTRDGAGIYFNGNGGRTLTITGSEILANGVGSSSHHADGRRNLPVSRIGEYHEHGHRAESDGCARRSHL